MPETFDFEQITTQILSSRRVQEDPLFAATMAGPLRLLWSARGIADLAKVENQLSTLMGETAGPYVKNIEHALQALDQT